MGFYYLLQPGKYAKSRSNAKDHDTLSKPFQLRHASFLLQKGKHHNAHQLTPCRKRRCNDFELSTMCMAMLSFDDQKSAAREDRVCQQYIGGTLCPGRSLYDRVYSLIDHVGKPTMHPKQEASTLPHLIPEEASSDAQDEYISQLMGYNDDCDTFDGPELGTIAPEGRPTKLKAAPKQRPPPTLYHPTFPAPQGM